MSAFNCLFIDFYQFIIEQILIQMGRVLNSLELAISRPLGNSILRTYLIS